MNKKEYLLKLKDALYKPYKKESNQVILSELLSSIPIDLSNIPPNKIDYEILRLSIIAELDAVNLYEQLAEKTKNENIKKVLLDIAQEEKVHVGEFQELLNQLDSENVPALEDGEKELNDLIRTNKNK